MESSIFQNYEKEFRDIINATSKRVDSISELNGDLRNTAIKNAERGIQDAEQLLKQMDMELRSLPASTRSQYSARLKTHSNTVKQLTLDFRKAKDASNRSELFGSTHYDIENPPMMDDQRARLLTSTHRLERSSDRLRESERTLAETEEIGAAILSDLHTQRATLERSKDKLSEADSNLSRASRTIRSMGRRVITDKAIMLTIILLLILVIVLIVYLKWIK